MAADAAPLSRVALAATSVVDDLSYVALADLARAVGPETGSNYRVIGGHMITALAARWQLDAALYRETGDADLGVPPVIARDAGLIERLMDLGYERTAGNRFARSMSDIPVFVSGGKQPIRNAVIDILVPAYTSRPRENRRFGDHLVTTEVPGLAIALNRAPVTLPMQLRRLNGEVLASEITFPDEIGALVLKALATRVRLKATDVVDIWRLLEVAFAAQVDATEFADGVPAESASIIRSLFDAPDGRGMKDLVAEQHLSDAGANERFTRVRALIARVLGTT